MVVVFGGSGMLGTDVRAELDRRGKSWVAPSSSEADLTDPGSVAAIFSTLAEPKFCINCAAFTAVDLAESQPDRAYAINAIGTGYLAQMCAIAGVKLLHVSTDFVFDGQATEPYREDAPTNPLGVYGASKLEGERSVLSASGTVVRTSWLFGPHGKSFPRTILSAYQAGKTLRVVADQVGGPTYTPDLARVLVDLIELPMGPPPGIFHASGPDAMSWYELAARVVAAAGGNGEDVIPIATEDWPTPAKRPKYSVLSNEKLQILGIAPMRSMYVVIPEFVKAVELQ